MEPCEVIKLHGFFDGDRTCKAIKKGLGPTSIILSVGEVIWSLYPINESIMWIFSTHTPWLLLRHHWKSGVFIKFQFPKNILYHKGVYYSRPSFRRRVLKTARPVKVGWFWLENHPVSSRRRFSWAGFNENTGILGTYETRRRKTAYYSKRPYVGISGKKFLLSVLYA